VTEQTSVRRVVGRGELVALLYRLGRQAASGVLTITVAGTARAEIFVLRRGAVMVSDADVAKRTAALRLARLASVEKMSVVFESGVSAYPPGATNALPLAPWARAHLEQQLDGALADAMLRDLAGVRLSIRVALAPEPAHCDEADRRMLAALASPRRLDQVWSIARTPRFRLLAFIHFLRSVDAVDVDGVVADRSAPIRSIDPRREAARRLLGIDAGADLEQVKRAYRRLARALHPDLQPDADHDSRRTLERRFAEVTAAYEALI
jgi:DnaJ-domain-containing protein 1